MQQILRPCHEAAFRVVFWTRRRCPRCRSASARSCLQPPVNTESLKSRMRGLSATAPDVACLHSWRSGTPLRRFGACPSPSGLSHCPKDLPRQACAFLAMCPQGLPRPLSDPWVLGPWVFTSLRFRKLEGLVLHDTDSHAGGAAPLLPADPGQPSSHVPCRCRQRRRGPAGRLDQRCRHTS